MKSDVPVFDRLLGSWTFTREVSPHAHMTGQATVGLIETGLALYYETTRVALAGGQILNGKQRYLYRRSPPPVNGFEILFPDTHQLFHRLHFAPDGQGRSIAKASHWCKADSYLSEYALDGAGNFHVLHIVSGPRKHYIAQTIYTRDQPRQKLNDI